MTLENTNIPGFIDLQVNGYKGVDFSSEDLTEGSFIQACSEILSTSTACFLPTVITGSRRMYKHNLAIISRIIQLEEFRFSLPGIHLEGPFLNPDRGSRGAHDLECIVEPDPDYFKQILDWSDGMIKLVTLAADMQGAEELCRHAVQNGIKVSLGHHLADSDDLKRLKDAGAGMLTHLGNGLPQQIDRHHNPIYAGLAEDGLYMSIITDNNHLPDEVIKIFIRAKGIDKTIIVSDASPLAGMKPGNYNVFGNDVTIERSGRIVISGTSYLAGSSATMIECMNHLASMELFKLDQLLQMGFYNPARFMNLDTQVIKPGNTITYDNDKKIFNLIRDKSC